MWKSHTSPSITSALRLQLASLLHLEAVYHVRKNVIDISRQADLLQFGGY
jgi:hypothetical protein